MLSMYNDPTTGRLVEVRPSAMGDASDFGAPSLIPSTPVVPDAELVWIYTSWLDAIATSRSLQASATISMLDSGELAYGAEGLEEHFASLDRRHLSDEQVSWVTMALSKLSNIRLSPTFALCGSLHGDQLALWREYARNQGVALALPAGADLKVLEERRGGAGLPMGMRTGWRRVLYSRPQQVELLRECVAYMLDHVGDVERCAAAYLHCVAFVKHPAYEVEQEVRSVFYWSDAGQQLDQFVRYRPGTQMPFIELAQSDGGVANFTGERALPSIRAVALAPPQRDVSRNRTEASVKTLLGDVEVVRSRIPSWL